MRHRRLCLSGLLLVALLSVQMASADSGQVRYFKYFLTIMPVDWVSEEDPTATADAENAYHLFLGASDHSAAITISIGKSEGNTARQIAQKFSREFGGASPMRNGALWEFEYTPNGQRGLFRVSTTDTHYMAVNLLGDIVTCVSIANRMYGTTAMGTALIGRGIQYSSKEGR